MESLRALWLFLRKEERTGMLSVMQRRSMRRGRRNGDEFDSSQPGDLILESLKEDGQAAAQLLL